MSKIEEKNTPAFKYAEDQRLADKACKELESGGEHPTMDAIIKRYYSYFERFVSQGWWANWSDYNRGCLHNFLANLIDLKTVCQYKALSSLKIYLSRILSNHMLEFISKLETENKFHLNEATYPSGRHGQQGQVSLIDFGHPSLRIAKGLSQAEKQAQGKRRTAIEMGDKVKRKYGRHHCWDVYWPDDPATALLKKQEHESYPQRLRETRVFINKALAELARLNSEQADVIRKCYFKGQKLKDIALEIYRFEQLDDKKEFKKIYQRIRTLKSRGLKKLKNILMELLERDDREIDDIKEFLSFGPPEFHGGL